MHVSGGQEIMRSLARDIRLTLFIKFSLLILLWFVCFKQVEKPRLSSQAWLLGPSMHTHANPDTDTTTHVKH